MVVGLIWTIGRVSVPLLVSAAIDDAITPGHTSALWGWSLLIATVALVVAVNTGLRRYWAFKVSRTSERRLRDRIFAHLQGLHFAFHDSVQTGDLMSRANTDLEQIQQFVVMIPLTICNFVTVAAVTVILALIDPWLTLLALGCLPFVNLLARRFSTRLHPKAMAIQRESADLANVVEETVSGVRIVKGFGAEPVMAGRLDAEVDDLYEASMGAARVRSRYLPALDLLPNIGLILVLAYGGHQVLDGQLQLGTLVAFNLYIGLLIWPLRMTGQIIALGQRAAASAQRVQAVLATDPVVVDDDARGVLPPTGGRVVFEDVSFAYQADQDVPVLDGLRLTIEAGESVALVGATGSGKSTVARLLPRFYDIDGGRILLDGVDVAQLPLRELRQAIGIVFEETFLFSDTIANNIAFAEPEATDDQIRARRPVGGGARVHHHAARGLPHRDRRAGVLAVGRPAPAPGHRPGHPRRPPGADPRRRHLVGRPHQGARDPRRAGRGDGGAHDHRHRPPAGHHRPGRPGGAARPGAGGGRGHPRPPAGHRRRLSGGAGRGRGPRPGPGRGDG